MYITDNKKIDISEFNNQKEKNVLDKILDRTLDNLAQEENFFIIKKDISESEDLEKEQKVAEKINNKIKFQNVIGFIGYGGNTLEIHSRFSEENSDDYFLHYMLEKVLNINIVNLETKISWEERIYDYLMLLFPKYLNDAVKKGLFKRYKYFEYNDSNIKGRIDINRHIKKNIPFEGKIAYSNREFSKDNNLIQLIRHTIEFIKNSPNGSNLLRMNETTTKNVELIVKSTLTYKYGKRQKIIKVNKVKKISHAYYTDYKKLQKLCLLILNRRKHNIASKKENNKIYGILFDVAWLWEEYVNTLLSGEFTHTQNKARNNSAKVYMFNNNTKPVYPDFFNKEKGIVLDAKYKILEDKDKKIYRNDLYQITSYAHILDASSSGLIYPSMEKEENKKQIIGILNGERPIEIFKIAIKIPQNKATYTEFKTSIEEKEKDFINEIESSF